MADFTIEQQRAIAMARARQRRAAVEGGNSDMSRIKSNVAKMPAQHAPEADIDGYIASEGSSIEAVRNFKMSPESSQAFIEVDLPDGSIAEFPRGTSRDVMQAALRRRFPSGASGSQGGSAATHEFEIQAPDGTIYEVQAPDERSAVNAFNKMLSGQQSAPNEPPTNSLPADDSLSELRTMSGGMLEGIPVVGPLIRGGVERAAATIAPFSDKTSSEVLSTIQQGTADEKAVNPYLDVGSQLAGGVGGTVPMIMAAPAAFGAGAGSLAGRSFFSGVSGMGLGSADSAVRSGGNPDAIATGAMMGGGAGLAGPAVGQVLGAGYRAIADRVGQRGAAAAADMTPRAFKTLNRAIGADDLNPTTVQQRLSELGPDAMLMDLGPNLQQQAAGLAALPGRGQDIIRQAVTARDAGANARILGGIDNTLGPARLPSQIEAGIRTNQQSLAPAFEQVFRGARAADSSPVAEGLESAAVNLRGPAQKAAQDVRRMLNVTGTDELDPNPYTLFQTRQAIDGMMASTTDTNAARVLSSARQQVDETLARSVPGIKEVDAQFAELARQREALGRGQQILCDGRSSPRPEELAREFSEGALPQGRQIGPSAVPLRLREGARDEIDCIVGTNANDRVALQRLIKGEGDWNRARMATVFGEDRAQRIINVLDREQLFSSTSNRVTRNSETAARTAAMQELNGGAGGLRFGPREGYIAGGALGAARSAGVQTAERFVQAMLGARREGSNAGLAAGLTATSAKQQIIDALLAGGQPRQIPKSHVDIAKALLLNGAIGGSR